MDNLLVKCPRCNKPYLGYKCPVCIDAWDNKDADVNKLFGGIFSDIFNVKEK